MNFFITNREIINRGGVESIREEGGREHVINVLNGGKSSFTVSE